MEFVLNVLEKLAVRYEGRKGLFGITPINEPITEPMWSTMDVPNRYKPVDPELAAGSAPNTLEFLRGFYEKAFARIAPHLAEDQYVVFHDAFRLKDWKAFLTQEAFRERAILDTHQYLMVAEAFGCPQNLSGYVKYIEEEWAKDIAEVQEYIPVVVGEWCVFNSYAVGVDTKGGQTSLNGLDFSENTEAFTPEQKKTIYQTIANATLNAWQNGSGYFYWSYKLLLDTVNEPNWIGWDSWDLGKCYDLGWFPGV